MEGTTRSIYGVISVRFKLKCRSLLDKLNENLPSLKFDCNSTPKKERQRS